MFVPVICAKKLEGTVKAVFFFLVLKIRTAHGSPHCPNGSAAVTNQ